MQAHDDPELRARVRAELLYGNVTFLDKDEEARRMWNAGFGIDEISKLQDRSWGDVFAAVGEQFRAKFG